MCKQYENIGLIDITQKLKLIQICVFHFSKPIFVIEIELY